MTVRRKLGWVAVLYFAEGMPFGIVKDVIPVWMRVGGASLETVGLLSAAGLPWTLKVLWSPLVDRYGERRDWISACLLVLAAATAAFAWLEPAPATLALWAALWVMTLASATQDIAIDAYTIGLIDRGEEGQANGVRVAAARVALIASGGGLVLLVPWLGWSAIYLVGAAAFVLLAVAARAAPRIVVPPAARRDWRAPLRLWLTRAGWPAVLAFALLYKLGDASMGPMVRPFWIDRGLGVAEIGLVSTTVGILLTIGGAIVGGRLTDRWGITAALLWLGIAQAVSNLGYAAVAWLDPPPPTTAVANVGEALAALTEPARASIYAASMIESFTSGLGTAAFLSFLMRICDKQHAAVQYAALSALFALSRDLAGSISGFATARMGYAPYFTLTFFLAFPGLALLPWVRGWVDERSGPVTGDDEK